MKKPKLTGKHFGYLGHFRQEKFIRQGHNDSAWPKGSMAEEQREVDEERDAMDAQDEENFHESAERAKEQSKRHDMRALAEGVRRDSIEMQRENEIADKTGEFDRAEREDARRKNPLVDRLPKK